MLLTSAFDVRDLSSAWSAAAVPESGWPDICFMRDKSISMALEREGQGLFASLRAKRSNPESLARHSPGLLRFARNDDKSASTHVGITGRQDNSMTGKARFIFPILMSGIKAFLMTALVTYLNLGFPADFLSRWMQAFVIAWPCAACSAFLAIPLARRGTAHIVKLVGE
jgi:hypothetical protein